MALMSYMTIVFVAFFVNVKPYDEPLLNSLELLGEVTNALSIDIFFCLMDLQKGKTP